MASNEYKYKKDKNGKYRPIHRLVMEEHIGRSLSTFEIVHHIDNNKYNNRIDNLKIISREEHTSLHHTGLKKTFPRDYKPHNKISEEIQIKIEKLYNSGMCYSKIGKTLKISGQTVSRYVLKINQEGLFFSPRVKSNWYQMNIKFMLKTSTTT